MGNQRLTLLSSRLAGKVGGKSTTGSDVITILIIQEENGFRLHSYIFYHHSRYFHRHFAGDQLLVTCRNGWLYDNIWLLGRLSYDLGCNERAEETFPEIKSIGYRRRHRWHRYDRTS